MCKDEWHGASVVSSSSHNDNPAASPPEGIDPTIQDNAKGIIYVDCHRGDDTFDGASASVVNAGQKKGPKKTINAGLRTAVQGDTVSVAGGTYCEKVHVVGIKLTTGGRVVIQ
jgi:hypothetical protein